MNPELTAGDGMVTLTIGGDIDGTSGPPPLQREGQGGMAEIRRTTLGTHVEAYLRQRVRAGTLTVRSAAGYRSTLHRLATAHGQRPANHLGRASLLAWSQTLGELRPATRRIQISQVRQFLVWLTAEGVLRRNPMAELPKVRQPRSTPRALDGEAWEKL